MSKYEPDKASLGSCDLSIKNILACTNEIELCETEEA